MPGEMSEDARAPTWGPGFLRFTTWPYRAEAALATLAILDALFLLNVTSRQLALVVFWAVLPDLVFIPIGIKAGRGRQWPRWGPALYNATHSLAVWLLVAAPVALLAPEVAPTLLGWAGHITADRALGFYLRAGPRDFLPAGGLTH